MRRRIQRERRATPWPPGMRAWPRDGGLPRTLWHPRAEILFPFPYCYSFRLLTTDRPPQSLPRPISRLRPITVKNGGNAMAAFYIGSYDIVDPDEFRKYPPIVLGLLSRYGGEVLASDTSGVLVEGAMRTMNAIIRFPTKEAALALYNDPDYQEAKRIRQASTRNVSMVLVDEFQTGQAVRAGAAG